MQKQVMVMLMVVGIVSGLASQTAAVPPCAAGAGTVQCTITAPARTTAMCTCTCPFGNAAKMYVDASSGGMGNVSVARYGCPNSTTFRGEMIWCQVGTPGGGNPC